jgi:hypothetical protein
MRRSSIVGRRHVRRLVDRVDRLLGKCGQLPNDRTRGERAPACECADNSGSKSQPVDRRVRGLVVKDR